MKYLFCCLPVLLSLACNKASTPTGPDTGPWYYFDLTGYGETLGPGYLKVHGKSTRELTRSWAPGTSPSSQTIAPCLCTRRPHSSTPGIS
jgi:hypothetical protein